MSPHPLSLAMELVLLLPFTKFAHAMYRPVALFFYPWAQTSRNRPPSSENMSH
jgi:hypothetical protein